MPKFVLECLDCDNRDFKWDNPIFICTDCGKEVHEDDAGKYLIMEDE